ncbi:small acid-soluble spore protein Tlp [Bacillus sp. AFS055030]|uniref:small acid-soluble spore protein Tlp n=1 Tax=Bacillus sp. AFS055030 TaxID=2033507 RepID=UPI000BFE74F0|nr:small acid-soluble spore protein Tlp [Bacillus sp. AFS055030]PGL68839.1 small acid-soluble spore protein Tlp [Bacillus sp. AFS055030]
MEQTQHTPNPDDRSDNANKIQNMINHTKENMKEAEASMKFGNEQDRQNVLAKNQRREVALEALESELRDEQAFNNTND